MTGCLNKSCIWILIGLDVVAEVVVTICLERLLLIEIIDEIVEKDGTVEDNGWKDLNEDELSNSRWGVTNGIKEEFELLTRITLLELEIMDRRVWVSWIVSVCNVGWLLSDNVPKKERKELLTFGEVNNVNWVRLARVDRDGTFVITVNLVDWFESGKVVRFML